MNRIKLKNILSFMLIILTCSAAAYGQQNPESTDESGITETNQYISTDNLASGKYNIIIFNFKNDTKLPKN
ncbi:MAG: hypothetical protein JW982_15305, partial [Spirochaetes bacterium]|nr:hypothetical protein [Spirochaetota bacterium]